MIKIEWIAQHGKGLQAGSLEDRRLQKPFRGLVGKIRSQRLHGNKSLTHTD